MTSPFGSSAKCPSESCIQKDPAFYSMCIEVECSCLGAGTINKAKGNLGWMFGSLVFTADTRDKISCFMIR